MSETAKKHKKATGARQTCQACGLTPTPQHWMNMFIGRHGVCQACKAGQTVSR